jgi:hypothetical protein
MVTAQAHLNPGGSGMQVTVAVASDITEADDIQARLAAAGISSQLERAEGADPGPVGDGPCRVLVQSDHAESALDVLATSEEEDEEEAW